MATDSFNIYLSPVGVKSLNRFVINWQAVVKLKPMIRLYYGQQNDFDRVSGMRMNTMVSWL